MLVWQKVLVITWKYKVSVNVRQVDILEGRRLTVGIGRLGLPEHEV